MFIKCFASHNLNIKIIKNSKRIKTILIIIVFIVIKNENYQYIIISYF